MKISLREFFKKGEFWSGLESTILLIKKHIKKHSSEIRELKNRDIILLQQIKILKDDNDSLRVKLEQLDERLWNSKVPQIEPRELNAVKDDVKKLSK